MSSRSTNSAPQISWVAWVFVSFAIYFLSMLIGLFIFFVAYQFAHSILINANHTDVQTQMIELYILRAAFVLAFVCVTLLSTIGEYFFLRDQLRSVNSWLVGNTVGWGILLVFMSVAFAANNDQLVPGIFPFFVICFALVRTSAAEGDTRHPAVLGCGSMLPMFCLYPLFLALSLFLTFRAWL